MAVTINHAQAYILRVRQLSDTLLKTLADFEAARLEWTAQDYTSSLANGSAPNNDGITAAEVSAVVNTTAPAIHELVYGNTGHATNLTNLLL